MVNQSRVKGGVLLGALVSGALAAGALGGAPTANATCASFFGIGNSAQCRSNLTSIAIAIGTNATAKADGLFGTAFAIGNAAVASTITNGGFNFASAIGDNSSGGAGGLLSLALQVGNKGGASAGSGLGNIAVNFTNNGPSNVLALGSGNIAVNLLGTGSGVVALGTANIAMNFLGDNSVFAGNAGTPAIASTAFSYFGGGNTVKAGPGPFAIAGSIGQNGQPITKVGPGFNINGLVVGGAAATHSNRVTKPAAAATRSTKAVATAASVGHKK
jgi:hypothetical protein